MKKYLRAIRRRLNMPKAWKDRVMADFLSEIEARKADGLTEEAIYAELGSPRTVARRLNMQMQEYTYRKSPWCWVCLALAVFSGLILAYGGLDNLLLILFNKVNNAASIAVIGGADGPTSIFVATPNRTGYHPLGLYALLMILGIIGFIALRKLKQK